MHRPQDHKGRPDDLFARLFEIDRHPVTDRGLHLPAPPFGPVGVFDIHAGFQHPVPSAPQGQLMYGALQTGEAAQQNRDGVMAALVGSRICHDLISPIGAIANGVELMGLAPGGGSAGGAELALISQSVDSANARIRFFRLAFGAAGDGSAVARPEVLSIIEALNGASRLKIDWQTGPDLSRGLVKLGFLAILAAESGLPYGGEVTVTTPAPGRMSLVARASRTRFDAALWSRLTDRRFGADPEGLRPAEVQFALFPDEVRCQGRQPRLDLTETGFVLEF